MNTDERNAAREQRAMEHAADMLGLDRPGDARGFVGPLKPPSADITKRDARWYEDQHVSSYYAWGRHDAGETRDSNDIYDWGLAWADAQWEFRGHYRSSMPSMQGGYTLFFAGERV
jgi:hypothetical protein